MIQRVSRGLSKRVDEVRKRWEAIWISRGPGYDGVKPPPLDPEFGRRVWAEDSPISRLLARNTRARQDAEAILNGSLRVFGRVVNRKDKAFSWHKDVFSGVCYEKVPYTRFPLNRDAGHDIIVPWELSRLQCIPTVIQAHRLTGDPKYVELFQNLVDDWIVENPPLVGVTWLTGMDVALRALNLGLGLFYFHDTLTERQDHYSKVLWSHAEYLWWNAIRRPRVPKNNHLLTAMAGLLALSLMFEARRADQLFRLAAKCLTEQVLRQFRRDGGNFESAINYHQLSLEAVLVGITLLSIANAAPPSVSKRHQLPPEAEDRVVKACGLVSDYSNSFKRSPQFGDSDDGRVLIHKDYFTWDPLDHSFLQDLAEVALPHRKVFSDSLVNRIYEASGYGFFCTHSYGICVNSSPVGEYVERASGHNHCDKGSLVLQVRGIPVLIDPGTYCYTPDLQARLRFKSTRAHNVIAVDGLEQGDVSAWQPFSGPRNIVPRIEYYESDGLCVFTVGHNGYARYKDLGGVLRTIRCGPSQVEIEDSIEGTGMHQVELLWHLHPAITFERRGDRIRLRSPEGRPLCRLLPPEGVEVSTEEGLYSPHYSAKVPNVVLVLSCRANLPWSCRTLIRIEDDRHMS